MSKSKHWPIIEASDFKTALSGKTYVKHPTFNDKLLMFFQDGAWWYRFDHFTKAAKGSKYDRGSTRTDDWFEAVVRASSDYDNARDAHRHGRSAHAPTFAKVAAGFLAHQGGIGVAKGERTAQRVVYYQARLDRFICPFIGNLPIDAVDNAACDELLSKRIIKAQGNGEPEPSGETHYKDVQLIRQILQHAISAKLITGSLAKPDLPKRPKARRATIGTDGQWQTLTAHLASRANYYAEGNPQWRSRRMLHAYVLILGYSGMRPGEARQLAFCDFGDMGLIRVPDGKTGRRNTWDDSGLVADVVAAIKTFHPTPDDPNAPLFITRYGEPVTEYHHNFAEVLAELGWTVDDEGNNISLYSLRHMFITTRLVAGTPEHALSTLCGTSAMQINAHYAHVDSHAARGMLRGSIPKAA